MFREVITCHFTAGGKNLDRLKHVDYQDNNERKKDSGVQDAAYK